jgi:hypothetical protein
MMQRWNTGNNLYDADFESYFSNSFIVNEQASNYNFIVMLHLLTPYSFLAPENNPQMNKAKIYLQTKQRVKDKESYEL